MGQASRPPGSRAVSTLATTGAPKQAEMGISLRCTEDASLTKRSAPRRGNAQEAPPCGLRYEPVFRTCAQTMRARRLGFLLLSAGLMVSAPYGSGASER